jgi:ABC-type glutathione transport system ATPase component
VISETLLSVQDLTKRFKLRGSLGEWVTRRPGDSHLAVDHVSFDLAHGEILGLAGGSGSGKTTLARMLIRLIEPDGGSITLEGRSVRDAGGHELREIRRRMQMVFQDPYSSLNPRLSIGAAILEAGRVHHQPGSDDSTAFVARFLDLVRLPVSMAGRQPSELSGGQRQRVAVARALAVGPDVLIADEAVSALDVSIQTQLLNLFLDLRDELGLTILFVAHQLSVIAEVADRVAIMHRGVIVEIGATADVFHSPHDEYTKSLLASHPSPAALDAAVEIGVDQ